MRRVLSVLLALAVIAGSGVGWWKGRQARAIGVAAAGSIALTDWQFPTSTPLGGAYSPSGADADLAGALGAGLLGYDPRLAYFPDLAAAVPTAANGGITFTGGNERITIQLKPDQRWSDGSAITGADYLLGLLLDLTPEEGHGFGLDQIQRLTFTSTTLTITYKGVYAAALAYGLPAPLPFSYLMRKYGVALPFALMGGYDADAVAAYLASPAYQGSALQRMARAWRADPYTAPGDVFDGPYAITSWAPGAHITLAPNPYYSALPPDPAHPRPARIEFVAVSDDAGVLARNMLTAATYNSIDEAGGFGPFDLQMLRRSSYHVLTQDGLGAVGLELNLATPALRDIRVRQALLYAIDKRAYLRAEFPGVDAGTLASLSLSAAIPSVSPWSNNAALPQSQYYPAKARALLAAAGYATTLNGPGTHLTLAFYSGDTPAQAQSAQLLQGYWTRIGVAVQIHYVPQSGPNGLYSSYGDGGILARRRYDVAQVVLALPPDPDLDLLRFDPNGIPSAGNPGGANVGAVRDPHLLAYLLAARQARDDTARAAIYDDYQLYLYRQAYTIMLFNTQNVVLVKGTIGNFQPNPQGNGWNAWEWWDTSL